MVHCFALIFLQGLNDLPYPHRNTIQDRIHQHQSNHSLLCTFQNHTQFHGLLISTKSDVTDKQGIWTRLCVAFFVVFNWKQPPPYKLFGIIATHSPYPSLNVKKSARPDEIPNFSIKNLPRTSIDSLFLQSSTDALTMTIFPSSWTLAKIVGTRSRAIPHVSQNFRTDSLLSKLGKLFKEANIDCKVDPMVSYIY